jgi:hypothetical protein
MIRHIIPGAAAALLAGAAFAHPQPADLIEAHEAQALGDAALAFVETLDAEQRSAVTFDLDDEEARAGWSNLPIVMAPRDGLAISQLDEPQRIALHALLARALSSEGYGEALAVMTFEDVLNALVRAEVEAAGDSLSDEQRSMAQTFIQAYDSQNYFVRLFGDPAGPAWAFVIDGHHLAVTATVVDGRIAHTPVFLGGNPQTIPSGDRAGSRAFQHELDAVSDFIAALDASQRAALVVSDDFRAGVLAGPDWTGGRPDAEGLPATSLTAFQAGLLFRAIEEFIGVAPSAAARRRLAEIEAAGPGSVYLGWWGEELDTSQRFMFRINAPDIHIDMTREGARGGGPGNHVHIVVRDPSNELGAQWLQDHYASAHAPSPQD